MDEYTTVSRAPRLAISVRLDRPFSELKEQVIELLEREYISLCLKETARNLSRASRKSGISRKHLRTLIAKHRLGTVQDEDGVPPVPPPQRFFLPWLKNR
jgi:DNA-binding NtrC family response regulator